MSGFVLHKCHLRQSYLFFNSFYSEFSASLFSINLERQKFSTESYGKERLFDIVIIGGGIVGLATSLRLKKRFPDFAIAVIEKEPYLAAHQSGNNGGVIHSGIYYKPGSLKAKLCIEGIYRLYKYCEENNIPHKRNGKLIVATNKQEVKWLKDLYENGIKNNVKDLQLIDSKKIKEIEPYCKGLKAIYSPNTGVINYGEFTRHIGHKLRELGGNILLNFCVTSITEGKEGDGSTKNDLATYPVKVTNDKNMTICARFVVTCGGLNSDKLAEMTDEIDGIKIIPIRGEYYFLPNEKKHLVQGSIYEVPNPDLPFHGVHFTSQLDGKIFVGPMAMLTPIKDGFQSSDYNLIDLWKLYSYPGLQMFLFKYFKPCFHELLKSVNSNAKLDKFKQFIPSLKLKDLIPRASVGVQAIALDTNGEIVEEFKFIEKQRILHCRSMPSPAATSSLAIASYLADKVQKQLKV